MLLALTLAASALAASSPPEPLLVVTVYEGGLTRVDCYVPTGGNVSISLPLLGLPDLSLGVIVVDEWGEPLAYAVNETLRTLFIANINSSLVRASYYTQDLTSKVGAAWSLNFTSPYRVRVVLPDNATVTDLGRLPQKVYNVGARIVLEFSPGLVSVKYVILYAAPPPPPSNQTTPGAQQSSTQPSEQQPEAQQPGSQPQQSPSQQQPSAWSQLLQPPLVYALAAVVAVLAVAAVALAASRRRVEQALAELSEEDLAILEALRRAGGGAFQSELQKAVGMPSTTMWRRVKRLEKLGYVVVEKRAGRNYVKLA